MVLKRKVKIILVSTIILSNIFIDQTSKYLARHNIHDKEIIHLITDVILLNKAENSGAAMGIGSNLPSTIKTIYFQILPFIFLLYLTRMLINSHEFSKLTIIGVSFSIGGGFGNICDRLIHGSVTDFVTLNIGIFKESIFNIADVSIVIGMIIVFFEILILSPIKYISRSNKS